MFQPPRLFLFVDVQTFFCNTFFYPKCFPIYCKISWENLPRQKWQLWTTLVSYLYFYDILFISLWKNSFCFFLKNWDMLFYIFLCLAFCNCALLNKKREKRKKKEKHFIKQLFARHSFCWLKRMEKKNLDLGRSRINKLWNFEINTTLFYIWKTKVASVFFL